MAVKARDFETYLSEFNVLLDGWAESVADVEWFVGDNEQEFDRYRALLENFEFMSDRQKANNAKQIAEVKQEYARYYKLFNSYKTLHDYCRNIVDSLREAERMLKALSLMDSLEEADFAPLDVKMKSIGAEFELIKNYRAKQGFTIELAFNTLASAIASFELAISALRNSI